MNKNKGFTTIELITSFTLASVIRIILFNIILILKDNLSEVNAKTNLLVEKDNLSYNINKRFKEKELSSVTMCDEGDKCYEFKYSDDTSDKLVYSNTDKSITFNNYTFDIIDGITVEEPTITEHYDTMSSTTYNGYFIINIPIKLDNKDYSIKVVKHFNTDSLVIDFTDYQYDTNGNKYTQVEYLESTGTQYIDTKYIPDENTGFYIDFILIDQINYNGKRIFGSSRRNDGNWGGIMLSSYSRYSGGQLVYGQRSKSTNPSLLTNQRMWISLLQKKYTSSTGANLELVQSSYFLSDLYGSIYMFNVHTDVETSTFTSLKLYILKLYDSDTLVRDYIPVIDSTERPCLFDKVSRECYYNQGTGEFLYG